MAEDKILTCRDCGRRFTFTVVEQELYAQKGFDDVPSRCAHCRETRRIQQARTQDIRFREKQDSSE